MANPNPNVSLIQGLEAAQTAQGIVSVLTDFGICFAIDVINFLMGVEKSYLDRACLIDFCIRHNGLMSLDSAKRIVNNGSFGWLGQKTNRCGNCRWIGHRAPNCPN
jgi:hypothetical protein